jgi:hypothetical protein
MRTHFLKVTYFLLALSAAGFVNAQEKAPRVDGWRIHGSFVTNNCVEEAGDQIFVGNNSSMFSLLKADNSVEVISRVNGLSEKKFQVE